MIWVTKLRGKGWAGNVARVGTGQRHTGFCRGNLRETDICGRILRILEMIYMKLDEGYGLDSPGSG